MRVAVLVAAALLVLARGAASAEHLSFDEAKQVAARDHKPVLIDFYATWCGPCKRFTAASESDADVKAALGGVVLCKLDAEKEGVSLAKDMTVQGYPTFVLLDANGATTSRWWGFDKADFLTRLADGIADPTTVDQKTARFEKTPTAKDAATLASYHETRAEYEDAVKYLDRAMELDPSLDFTYRKFDCVSSGFTRKELFGLKAVMNAANAVVKSKSAQPWDLVSVANTMRDLGRRLGSTDILVPYLGPALDATDKATDPELMRQHQLLSVDHALFIEQDKDKALGLERQTLPEGWKEDSTQLNGFAWWCFENGVNLEEAEALARHGAELAPAGSERAMVLDTAAEICNARKNVDGAVDLERRAILENPASDYYKKQLERFRGLEASHAN
ncbi:MAG: thioredoxin domain-containing protein [bacterium]